MFPFAVEVKLGCFGIEAVAVAAGRRFTHAIPQLAPLQLWGSWGASFKLLIPQLLPVLPRALSHTGSFGAGI